MFRFSVVSSALLLFAVTAPPSWADGLFEETSRDFGVVPRGQVLTYPFRVVNNTSNTVVISGVRVSCNRCSSARALASTLAPGQETSVIATMNSGLFEGFKEITVYVSFSQPRFEEIQLKVRATSRDDLGFSPDSLNFGQVKRGKEATTSMTVTFYGMPTTQITEIKSESNYVVPSLEEVKRDGGEVVYKINGKLRADTPAGKWFTDLWIKTNNPAVPRLRVPATVEVEGSAATLPNTVALGKVKAGAETDRIVVLRGVKAFRILNISGTDDKVRVREEKTESNNVHTLTLTLLAAEPGELNRVIRIQTDLKSGDIQFNAQAQIVP
ncbi:MAG: DUF1573 domain-containing protein [Gemmataceae bacterium]